MTGVQLIEVTSPEEGVRLDNWFKARFPEIAFGKLQKLMRTGQVRVDGGRVKPGTRLETGQMVRVPPFGSAPEKSPSVPKVPKVSDADRKDIQRAVLHRDDDIIVINKAAGLAVQGGTGTSRHVDGMLEALRFGSSERPKLVHRLDKDTSGVLVIARNVQSARYLTALFRTKEVRKLYWALVVGVPNPDDGLIKLRLIKAPGKGGERMVVDEINGKHAASRYKVLDHAGKQAAFVALEPLTGRTHQLRIHLAEALGTPIAGDGKYGGNEAYLEGGGIEKKLHLHARRIQIPLATGKSIEVTAPLPKHIKSSLDYLGFHSEEGYDQFLELE
jgi:23S rRNA pseudouridine955/2504/2580 synthase